MPYPAAGDPDARLPVHRATSGPIAGPLGDPYRLDGDNPPSAEELTEETFVHVRRHDAGPTKAWLVTIRNDPRWKPYFERAYGKRPREELYDLKSDPDQVKNVAADPAYAGTRRSSNGGCSTS